MRNTTIKTVVVALSLTAMTIALPADAKVRNSAPVTNGRFEERFRDQDPVFGGTPVQRFVHLVKKVVVIVQELPLIPIP